MLTKKTLFMSLLLCAATYLPAEEGMWTFNNLPLESIKKQYDTVLDKAWIERAQKSGLRISLGGSGSFVSPRGLVMTNHHVGAKAVYNLSTQERDLMEKGFLAKTLDEELKCPNMYVDQLISIQDVTSEVNAAARDEMSPADREAARQIAISDIKSKAQAKTGLQPEVVSLYQGARYNLYLYKRYSDVRLVMAPEKSIAYFGGDADNFEYPRYDLDACFFRVYEDGKPLATKDYFKWSPSGPKLGEVLFVVGNPGQTNRMFTSSHIQFYDTQELVLRQKWIKDQIANLHNFAKENPENKRIAAQDLFSLENTRKVVDNLIDGLTHSPIIENKKAYEHELYAKTGNDQPWKAIDAALTEAKPYYADYLVLEKFGMSYSKLYAWARNLVRLSAEKAKPSKDRLKEYADTELPKLELDLFSTEPQYTNLEKARLKGSFQRMIDTLGPNHPVTKLLLNGKSIEERVDQLLASTQLFDLEYRKRLYNNLKEVDTSTDPLIVLAKAIDPYARALRQKKEDNLDSALNENYALIAKVIFDRYGETVYPDATFTPRLSYGAMKGYFEDGTSVPPLTTMGGAYAYAKKHDFVEPYKLPQSWMDGEKTVDKKTALNFVSTHDIIGGNSGSPVINKKGEIVGLIFDGNIQSIVWSFAYNDVQGRSTSVHSAGILEALKNIYGAKNLVLELQGKK
jgi:hypothetical protein